MLLDCAVKRFSDGVIVQRKWFSTLLCKIFIEFHGRSFGWALTNGALWAFG